MVIREDEVGSDEEIQKENGPRSRKRVLVSSEAAEVLQTAGEGSLGANVKNFLKKACFI